ncbi:XRE family transcriptional regulator [Streptomyces sp. ICN441]|uniref:helix-turn-helix domain-containing protein n=1 Tax=Streptomyces sp. ICN441 TaxID=2558286 RepID=UPI00106B4F82|nr:helix-turn-helix transcriptional regulator [Streptomyces sp. ICN441]TFE48998.1 XRE family transcriptional regulator [Streptomyces sp. ICN441]
MSGIGVKRAVSFRFMESESGADPLPHPRLTRKEAEDLWAQMLNDAPTFAVAIGGQLRQAREEAQRTAEDVAQTARHLGLAWHRPTVGQIELGKRGLTAAELLLLPMVYGRPLRDLLPPADGAVWLTEETAVYGAELHRVLDAEYAPGKSGRLGPGSWHRRKRISEEDALEFVHRLAAKSSPWPHGAQVKHLEQPDEAETKAAKKLDTTPHYVAYTARELWGHGLVAEREARLAERPDLPESPRALQAARGHVTRTLIEEMEPTIRAHESKRGQPEEIDWEEFSEGTGKADG